MIDADIYLDVDGVLFTYHKNRFHLRNGITEFLEFLTNNFQNCYWLTSWYAGFNDVLKLIYAGDIAVKFKTCNWEDNKALSIDFTRNFVWIEDGISKQETNVLRNNKCYENYIYVNPKGDLNRLYRIKKELIRRFNIR